MYHQAAQAQLSEPVLAAARFTRTPSQAGGSGDWISVVMKPVAVVMSRLERDLPRHLVVAVTADRVYLLPVTRTGVAREVVSWARSHVKSSASRALAGWAVWIDPPGDRRGFELRSKGGFEADAVVAALMKQPD